MTFNYNLGMKRLIMKAKGNKKYCFGKSKLDHEKYKEILDEAIKNANEKIRKQMPISDIMYGFERSICQYCVKVHT